MGIGTGQAGILSLNDTELDNLTGWTTLSFGISTASNAINVGARNWGSNVILISGTSAPIHINGNQNLGTHDLKITTDSDPDIAFDLFGTGTLTVSSIQNNTSMGVAGESGTVNVSVAELNRMVNNGWSSLSFLNPSSSAENRIGAYAGWKQRVLFSGGTGGVNFTGIQDFNNNSADIIGQNNITIGAELRNLYDLQIIQSNAAKTMGIGSGAGDFQIDQAELDRLKISHALNTSYSASSYAALNVANAAFGNYIVNAKNIGNVNLGGAITSAYAGPSTTASLAFITTTTGTNGGNLSIASGTTIDPGTGRYAVYSRSPLLDSYNGFVRTQKTYNRALNSYQTYAITEQGNIFLYGIAPSISLAAVNASREYGDANPAFTYTATGLIDGDSISDALSSFGLTTPATATSDVGAYAINAAPVASGLRYNITSATGGTLDVTKATVTVTADPIVTLLGQIPVFTASFIGLKLGQTPDTLGTPLLFITDAPPGFDRRGTYTVTPYGVVNTNYTFVFLDGALRIKGRRHNAAPGTPGSTCLSRTMACPSDLKDQPDGAMTPLSAVLAAITQSYDEPQQDPNSANTLTSPIRVSPDVASFYGFNPKPL